MDDSSILVSIIMPAYNASGTIARAIESALRQTEPHLEVLVIDDASLDSTPAIAERIATRDQRVRLLRQAKNRGPAAARNRGLERARGTWVALLDADDAILPERIKTLAALGDQHAADIVADNLLLCPAQGSRDASAMISRSRLPTAQWMTAAQFVTGNIGSRYTPRVSYGFLQPLMRRAFLDANTLRYDERNRFGEDFLFSLACLLKGARWWITPQPMYQYTVQAGTLTDAQSAGDLLRIRKHEEALLRHHPAVAADPALADALRRHKRIVEHFYYYRAFTDALKRKNFAPAANLLLESPKGFRDILTESALQAPRVALKALRGGFRHGAAVSLTAAAGTAQDRQTQA